jgi:hypothetical protein
MTIAEHIEDAHVLLGITSATAQQNTRALRAFLQMMRALPGRIGAKWAPVVGTAGYTTTEGERVVCDAPMTVYIPDYVYIANGVGVDPDDTYSSSTMRLPRDGARVQVIDASDNTERLWFYRADRAQWSEVGELTATSDSPLSAEFDLYLPAMLAVWLHDQFPGSNLGEATIARAQEGYSRIRAKLRAPVKVGVEATLLINSLQTHSRGYEL